MPQAHCETPEELTPEQLDRVGGGTPRRGQKRDRHPLHRRWAGIALALEAVE